MNKAKLEWYKARIQGGDYSVPSDVLAETLEEKVLRYRLNIRRRVNQTRAEERHQKRIHDAVRGAQAALLGLLLLPTVAHAEFNCGAYVWLNDEISTPLEADICDTLRLSDNGVAEIMAERDAALAGNCHPEDLWQDDSGIAEDRAIFRKLSRRLRVALRRIRKHGRK